MKTRFRDAEKLAATVRDGLAPVAIEWLVAIREEMEKLTRAALAGDITEEDFRAMVADTSARMPALLEQMDHQALATHLEGAMGAAMGNGIAARAKEEKRAKLPWETDAWLGAGGKGKKCGDSHIAAWKKCRPKFREQEWEGTPKQMQARAAEAMKALPIMQHPESGIEMRVTGDGINKSLREMRRPHEFMAAARLPELYLHAVIKGRLEPDRKLRRNIEGFQRFEVELSFGASSYTAEIISKKLTGEETHHLKQVRLKK
jgi:hypothetical protein